MILQTEIGDKMELYLRKVTIFDKQIVDDFAREHYAVKDKIEAGDCSLILGKTYEEYDDFYEWFKAEQKLDREEDLKKNQVGCTTYLVLTKEDDELIALLDMRHSLDYNHGSLYGHIGIDIRPTKRNKGYYKEILKLSVELAKELKMKKLVIACDYTNIPSKKGIERVFGDDYQLVPVEGSYYLVYEKDLRKKG